MTNVIPFPAKPQPDRIEVLVGRDDRGRKVWLFDLVQFDHAGISRCIMSDHYSLDEVCAASEEWLRAGVNVQWAAGHCPGIQRESTSSSVSSLTFDRGRA